MLVPKTAIPTGIFSLYIAHTTKWTTIKSTDPDEPDSHVLIYEVSELLYADTYNPKENVQAIENICLNLGVFPHAVLAECTGGEALGEIYLTHVSDPHSHEGAPDRSELYTVQTVKNGRHIDIEEYL
jgi:hypothetical protein